MSDAILAPPQPIWEADPSAFDKAIVEAGMALYHPGQRTRLNEWQPDASGRYFVAVSALVKNTASQYADYIRAEAEAVDETNGFWGQQGNTLAEAHLAPQTPYREVQVRDPLGDFEFGGKARPYDIVGHIDGVIVQDAQARNISHLPTSQWPDTIYITCAEAKHQDPDDGEAGGNLDRAERQATSYFSIMAKQIAAGVRRFPLSMDEAERVAQGKSDARPLEIPPHCAPVMRGVSLHIWPRNTPPALVVSKKVEPWRSAQCLDRLRRKAEAVLGEQGAAMAWDIGPEGTCEFKVTMSAEQAGLPNRPMLLNTLLAEQAARFEKAWAAQKRQAQGLVLAEMARASLRKTTLSSPDEAADIWAAPTFRSNKEGTTWLTPNLRGAWPDERLAEAISLLSAPAKETAP